MITSNTAFNDAGIRPVLREKILFNQENETVIIEELGICRGQVRIDMAVVNGSLQGYEIKSDRDSLTRLYGQVDLYSKVLDYATLVIGERHIVDALDMVPEWWSILQIFPNTDSPNLFTLRQGKRNPKKDSRALVELIWRDEALALLEKRSLDRGVRTKSRTYIWDKVCEHFTVEEISEAVRIQLKARSKKRLNLR